jgi:flagella basal body P-ring formation protein FlgA
MARRLLDKVMPRHASIYRRLPAGLCLAVSLAHAGSSQVLPQLEALAKAEALRELPPLTDRQRLQIGPIDPHVELGRCDGPPRAALAPGFKVRDRVLVELRCDGATAWHIYVPVRVVGTSSAAIAAHALVAGSVITAADVRVEQRDLGQLPPGYLDDPAIAVGLTAVRPIAGGTVLTNQQLAGSPAVQRGQQVTLLAAAAGMSVRSAGRALNDGLVNQRVRVLNLSSGKIVEGVARSAQVVEIVFQ